MLKHFCLSISILLLFAFAVCGQERKVTISIVNSNRQPIPFATVKANGTVDSIKSMQKVTDSSGVAIFKLFQGNQYIIGVTSVGYAAAEKKVVITGDNKFTITAVASSKALSNVTVTATKPIMRQEDDKTIVDPENLAASSTNAFEILEKTPGLFVDQDGNVYLSSTTPAKIYINGREQRMSTTDIATMLRSLPPNSIQSIEIMRTPSAKYDASGSGGIVNVILKKGVRIGFNGSVNGGFNQGVYGNQFIGFNLTNSEGKTNAYLNVQYNRRNNYDQIKTDRLFATDSLLRQDAYTRYPQNSVYVGAGIGYTFNSKWEINYDGRVSINRSYNNTDNRSDINKISNGQLIASTIADVNNTTRNTSTTQSISTRYKIDTVGSEWTTDLSYTGSPVSTIQNFTTNVAFPVTTSRSGDGNVKTNLNFYSMSTNALFKLPKKITIETGYKSTFVDFSNNANYFKGADGNRAIDSFRTTAFRYNENINAGYIQASKNLNGIILKAGVRAENTNMNGNQLVPQDTSFSINRTDLFPYVYLSRSVMKIMGYELKAYLIYRRTINRPGYDLLNPFPRYIDPFLYETGNPALRPQFTKNYEFNISVDERPIFAVGINNTKDIFTNVIYQDSTKAVAFRTYDNLGTNKETYFRILGAIPGKKYFAVAGAQYNHNFYQGLYEKQPLSFKRGSWSIFTYQTLKVTPNTLFTLNGFVRFNGQLQFYELSTFGGLMFSITQQFLNKKLVATLSVNDVFYTNRNKFTIQQGSVNASGSRQADTRRVGISLRYNFGFRKKEDNNMFNVESPDKTN